MSDSHNKVSQTLKLDFFGPQPLLPLSFHILLLCSLQFICLPSPGCPPPLVSLSLSVTACLPVLEAGAKLHAVYWASLHFQNRYCWMGLWINKKKKEENYRVCKWPQSGSYHDSRWCHCSGDGALLTQKLTIIQFQCLLLLYKKKNTLYWLSTNQKAVKCWAFPCNNWLKVVFICY